MSKQVISTINMSTCKPVNLSTKIKKIMATFLDEIKRRLQVWHEQRAERIEAKQQAELDAEAREAVQVMEFNANSMYVYTAYRYSVNVILVTTLQRLLLLVVKRIKTGRRKNYGNGQELRSILYPVKEDAWC